MTTQQEHKSPAGDLMPVPVHVTGIEAELAASLRASDAPQKRRRLVSNYETVTLDQTNNCRPVLAENRNRHRAVLIVHGALGGASLTTSFAWLDSTEAGAVTAARTQTGGAYISAANTINIPFEVRGTNALWGCLDAAATTVVTITVIEEVWEDG